MTSPSPASPPPDVPGHLLALPAVVLFAVVVLTLPGIPEPQVPVVVENESFPELDLTSPVASFPKLARGEQAILFGGDVLWTRDYWNFAKKKNKTRDKKDRKKGYGLDYPAEAVLPLIRSAEAVAFVANHEGPITKRGKRSERCPPAKNWNYRSRLRNREALTRVGFTHLSMANNHALDRCWEGLEETLGHFDDLGIVAFGAGSNIDEARAPAVIEVGETRVAIAGGMEAWEQYRDATPPWNASSDRGGLAFLNKSGIPALLSAARAEADIVVAFPHWGRNYSKVKGTQKRIAKRLVAAGADVIIGHHGHAAQAFGHTEGVPTMWGLGNLFFGTPGRFGHDKMQPGYGLLARMVLKDGAIDRFELVPIMLNNRLVEFQPRLCTVEESRKVLGELAQLGGAEVVFDGGVGIFRAEAPDHPGRSTR